MEKRGGVGGDMILPLFDGTFKTADEISLNNADEISLDDVLIGDDGKERYVFSIQNKVGQLYEVKQENGMTYYIGADHTLTLKMPKHKWTVYDETKKEWSVSWWNERTQEICRMKETLYWEIQEDQECLSHIPDLDVLEINVLAYLKLPQWSKDLLEGYKFQGGSTGKLTISLAGENKLVCFKTNENNRFILQDGTVTHT